MQRWMISFRWSLHVSPRTSLVRRRARASPLTSIPSSCPTWLESPPWPLLSDHVTTKPPPSNAVAAGLPIEAIVIAAIVLANGVLGFLQERQAEAAVAALQRMAAPMAEVMWS